ncbi:EpsG family protein [Tenacibaculum soleae]|uniref:EpsG family protein n=1 Tax=Tenacibaculum soleae TaxID=447689 RepID=UPI0026E2529C|nr:EpsG family protein [Tenacibaculum soleae]MDO6743444.1 EpsG family protein [Tenacibaculum soleae]
MNYIAYNLVFVISLLLSHLYQKVEYRYKKYLFYILIFSVVTFVSIRFDVGPDYSNYVQAFKTVIYYDSVLSPDYQFFGFLSELFGNSEKGYIGVFAIYFLITFWLIATTLKRYNILFLGMVVFFGFGFFWDSMDRIRQYAAIGIFVYSVKDIVDNNFFNFFLKIIIAVMLHVSALALLPVYFIAKIRINRVFTMFIFVALILGYYSNLFEKLIFYFYSLVPYYGEIYLQSNHVENINQFNSGLGFLTKAIFVFIVAFFAPVNYKYRTLLVIGLIMMVFASGNLNIDRFSDYFTIVIIIALPIMVQNIQLKYNKLFILIPLFLYLFVLFESEIGKTNFDYQTIFSNNFKNQIFESRD